MYACDNISPNFSFEYFFFVTQMKKYWCVFFKKFSIIVKIKRTSQSAGEALPSLPLHAHDRLYGRKSPFSTLAHI